MVGQAEAQSWSRQTDMEVQQGRMHVLYWLCVTWHEYLAEMMHRLQHASYRC